MEMRIPDFDGGRDLTQADMLDDRLKLVIQALGEQLAVPGRDPRATVAILLSETVKFRDKLKQETGQVLTVGDTQTALDALDEHLRGQSIPDGLTAEQRALTQIYIDRLTLFA